ncbi:MAG TPA: 3-hexulose-6-phosphate synthase [Spirochaetia bacterium]|nr:3-hexulose-6-phosphate synthase [Spirochaetia bacterium]
MKLQLALDVESLAAARAVLEKTADLVDIAEVGTPLILKTGTAVVTALKTEYPRLAILADFKIMDAGEMEAAIAFEAGADIVTVLAAAETVTIRRACEAARHAGREVMADLIAVADPARRAAEVLDAGVHILCCHVAFDRQSAGVDPAAELAGVRAALPGARVAVAGGMTPDAVRQVRALKPEIVIVGGFVTRAVDPRAAAAAVRSALDQP